MVVLEYCAKHNMIAYLEKIEENAQFHEIVDFLSRSLIFYALTSINAKVAGKPIVITEASIRGDLLFNDVDGINCLTNKIMILLKTLEWTKRAQVGVEGIRVLALETVKDTQAKEILTLKARIKKLEKRFKPSISHHKSWLRSLSLFSKKKKLNIEYMDTEEAVNEGRQSTDDDTARPDVSTARPDDDTARPDVSTARQELNTLIKLKDDKAKGVAFKDSESTDRPVRSILTLKPILTIDPKDKGKGVLEEPEFAKKTSKSDFDATQIAIDEKIARQLEVELQAEVEKERQREEQASLNYIENLYDEVQARIDADHEFTHSQLNKKSFEDIQGLYIKEQELITDFVPIRSVEDERMIRDMNKKSEEESSDKGVDNTKKRKERSRMKRMSKRQKTDIFRSDGSSRWIKTFSEMVTRFDRLDLVELYNLVMQRFESTTLEEDGTEIHMRAEMSYPLTTRTLERMLSLRLIVESVSDAAYDLLRFIQKQTDKSREHDRGEKDL
nr:hypothetical protein [Tanacetum cinerariifolium]